MNTKKELDTLAQLQGDSLTTTIPDSQHPEISLDGTVCSKICRAILLFMQSQKELRSGIDDNILSFPVGEESDCGSEVLELNNEAETGTIAETQRCQVYC